MPSLHRRTSALVLAVVLCSGCSDVTHTVGTVNEGSGELRGGAQPSDAPRESDDGSTAPSSPPTRTDSPSATPPRPTTMVGDAINAGSSAPPPQFTAPDGCVWDVQVAYNRRLDMYLMVDSNITLPFVGGWDNLVSGLSVYADHPRSAGTGVGVRFFGLECTPNTYAMPDATVEPLPGNAAAIKSAFPLPFNFSPMRPALEGAIVHARSRANAHPEWKQVVVFMTDGFSTDISCLTTPDSLVDIAEEGFTGTPSIPTYVIALSSPELPPNFWDPTDRLGPLEQVARAGGTGDPRPIDLQAPAGDIVNALLDVQRAAEPCEYVLPVDLSVDVDQLALALWNSTEPVPRVERRGLCDEDPGYYLDDPDAPRHLVACPQTCDTIRADGNRPNLLTGCEAPLR